jgi:hypothetical protein
VTDIDIQRGSFKVLRVDGSEHIVPEKPNFKLIGEMIGADCFDTVRLKQYPPIVMVVDDIGAMRDKPVNEAATQLYLSVCKPGTTWQIRGDVAICHDHDF